MKLKIRTLNFIFFILIVLFAITSFFIMEKRVDYLILNGVQKPVKADLFLNQEIVFSDTIHSTFILPQAIELHAKTGINNLSLTIEELEYKKSIDFFVLFRQWVVIILYEEEIDGIGITIHNRFFPYYPS
jgi:hypothetical protein